ARDVELFLERKQKIERCRGLDAELAEDVGAAAETRVDPRDPNDDGANLLLDPRIRHGIVVLPRRGASRKGISVRAWGGPWAKRSCSWRTTSTCGTPSRSSSRGSATSSTAPPRGRRRSSTSRRTGGRA